MNFEQANAKVHHVADQWHYETMILGGFIPQNLEAAGFVRSYTYHKPVGDITHIIVVTTGASSDYWTDKTNGGSGYWAALAPHVKKIG